MASKSESSGQKEQKHPQYMDDRQVVNSLLAGEPTDYNLAEMARLIMRYQGFPGAYDIQADLAKVMHRWKYTEDTLFEKTREIHQTSEVYRNVGGRGGEDWS
ncbi:MAG: DUF3288 family protein [Leptolyngbyaceae bacterium]|nr:DUF3288 family protein [Leptolyngbyaceae bacterium]